MALVLADRVKESCTSPGTSTVTLLGAATEYQSFSAGVGANNTTYYTIADQAGSNWEVGLGTVGSGGTTLARTTVLSSSNSGSLVNFSSGSQDVYCDYTAETAILASNNPGTSGQVLTSGGTGVAPTWTTPTTGTVTSVTGTAPIVSSGGNTPAISMAAANTTTNGYLTSTDWNTFNGKGSGSVTSVAATVPSFLSVSGSPITSSGTLALTYSGTALPAANGGTGLTSPGTTGNVLTSNGTGWVSSAPTAAIGPITINATEVTSNQTIATGTNGFSVGPMTIDSGVTVTVSSGQRWVVI